MDPLGPREIRQCRKVITDFIESELLSHFSNEAIVIALLQMSGATMFAAHADNPWQVKHNFLNMASQVAAKYYRDYAPPQGRVH